MHTWTDDKVTNSNPTLSNLAARKTEKPTPKRITLTEMKVVKTAGHNQQTIVFEVNLLDPNAVKAWSNRHNKQVEEYKSSKNYNAEGLEKQNMVDKYAALINYMTFPTIKTWWGECYEGKVPITKKEALRDLADYLANIMGLM